MVFINKKFKRKIIYLLLSLLIICFIGIYEIHISYNSLEVKNYSITNSKINDSIDGAIISDLHDNQLGENNKELIDKINSQSPDIILVIGDMIDSDSKNSKIVINLMKELCKESKVFFSLGNSDIDYIEAKTKFCKELSNGLQIYPWYTIIRLSVVKGAEKMEEER